MSESRLQRKIIPWISFIILILSCPLNAQPIEFLEKFHEIDLNIPLNEQAESIELLLNNALTYRESNTENAEAWIATALIRAGYSRTQGIKALSTLKVVRDEFETAIELDKESLDGYAQAFLGRLYYILPPWPISFGSNKKAKKYLEEALTIEPNSIPNNFYYAEFLIEKKQIEEANQYLNKANASSPRINTPNWNASLLKGIENLKSSLESKE